MAASRKSPPSLAVAEAREAAWAGQHARAVEIASAALAAADLDADARLALLDLRSESRLAQGELAPARSDVATMLAQAGRNPGRRALAARARRPGLRPA